MPVDDYLSAGRDTVCLIDGATLWVDTNAFIEALQAAATDEHPERTWEEAVGYYTGDLCEGLYHDWCLAERERFERLLLRTLGQLMAACGAREAYDEAAALGRRILARDPLREEIHRALMSYSYRAGNRAEAVRRYQRCRDLLRSELGVDPHAGDAGALPANQRRPAGSPPGRAAAAAAGGPHPPARHDGQHGAHDRAAHDGDEPAGTPLHRGGPGPLTPVAGGVRLL
ncbi:MAG: bacterial transcriptional activator domain-containing protein [Anaerolineae bacterium]|nr:bacterial transcriptional activator domain-containing protein [Anaerolineae bacterium]